MRFVIDGDESGAVLHAEGESAERWNGWRVPHATFLEFVDYLTAVDASDPDAERLTVASVCVDKRGVMRTFDAAGDLRDEWVKVGETADRQAIFALDGWCWEAAV